MSWQPIETSPRDGTMILLAESSGFVHVAQWGTDGYWRYRVSDPDLKWEPIEWMPLPTHMGLPHRGGEV